MSEQGGLWGNWACLQSKWSSVLRKGWERGGGIAGMWKVSEKDPVPGFTDLRLRHPDTPRESMTSGEYGRSCPDILS